MGTSLLISRYKNLKKSNQAIVIIIAPFNPFQQKLINSIATITLLFIVHVHLRLKYLFTISKGHEYLYV